MRLTGAGDAVCRRGLLLRESLAIVVVSGAIKARAFLRQPALADRVFERAAVAVDRPGADMENREITEAAAAKAARKCEPGPACGGPVEHLHLEVMRIPRLSFQSLHRRSSSPISPTKSPTTPNRLDPSD